MLDLLLVFIAVDWVWAAYIIHTSQKNPVRASFLSAAIVCLGCFITLSYINDKRAVIVMAVGAFIGTYLSIKFDKKKEK